MKIKIIDVLAIIVSIIALAGSLFVIYALAIEVGPVMSEIASIGSSGLADPAAVQPLIDFVNMLILLGWVWSLAVLGASAYAIYAAVKRIRAKA